MKEKKKYIMKNEEVKHKRSRKPLLLLKEKLLELRNNSKEDRILKLKLIERDLHLIKSLFNVHVKLAINSLDIPIDENKILKRDDDIKGTDPNPVDTFNEDLFKNKEFNNHLENLASGSPKRRMFEMPKKQFISNEDFDLQNETHVEQQSFFQHSSRDILENEAFKWAQCSIQKNEISFQLKTGVETPGNNIPTWTSVKSQVCTQYPFYSQFKPQCQPHSQDITQQQHETEIKHFNQPNLTENSFKNQSSFYYQKFERSEDHPSIVDTCREQSH